MRFDSTDRVTVVENLRTRERVRVADVTRVGDAIARWLASEQNDGQTSQGVSDEDQS